MLPGHFKVGGDSLRCPLRLSGRFGIMMTRRNWGESDTWPVLRPPRTLEAEADWTIAHRNLSARHRRQGQAGKSRSPMNLEVVHDRGVYEEGALVSRAVRWSPGPVQRHRRSVGLIGLGCCLSGEDIHQRPSRTDRSWEQRRDSTERALRLRLHLLHSRRRAVQPAISPGSGASGPGTVGAAGHCER